MSSIRRNLLVALLSAFALVIAVGAAATYLRARSEANEMFDYHLRQLALSLRDQAFRNAPAPELQPGEEDYDFVIQVWDADGVRLFLSHPHHSLPGQVQLGFSTTETPAGAWRVFATQQRGLTIQVSQPTRVRDHLAATAALRILIPFLLLLPISAVLIWWLVGAGLRPLGRLAHAVSARSPGALEALPEERVPDEVKPLVHALNDLLLRLGHAFATQRAFIADAAHELRTPLTALQLQVQLTERARSEAERTQALADLRHGLLRASHVVQQLLTLARQEPGTSERAFAPVNLDELARLAVAEQLPLAEARNIDLGIGHGDANAIVEGDADALRSLFSNLLDNAIRYTPSGGRVDVDVHRAADSVWLRVCDTGPGIPPDERKRVFDRFYRSEGTSEPGSGLGLAIVKTIADRHRARVALDGSAEGGLVVRVVFPLPGPPA